MSNPYSQEPPTGRSQDATDARRSQMSELLRQALQSINSGATGENAAITPEALAELAQRAGIGGAGQLADLGRVMGTYAGASAVPQVPQHILFLLGDAECALPSEAVQGVERITEVTPVPNTAPWVLGVVQVWGNIISVVDLRRYLNLPPISFTSRSRLLVVTRNDMTIGMVVDGVTEMRPLGSEPVLGADASGAPDWAREYADTVVQVDGRLVYLLDPGRLLFSDTMQNYRVGVEAR